MIRMMIRMVPSDMAFSPTGGRQSGIRRAPIRKAYPAVWFQRRTPPALFRLQLQRRRIDAVAQSGRAGAVLEDMAEMAVALRTKHLGADHAVADVALLVDMALRCGLRKTRPAAAGIELGVGFEQRLPAAGAGIGARPVLMFVFAGERPFGRLLAQHRVLHRRQFLAPLGFALCDLWRCLGVRHETSFAAIAPLVSDLDITDQSGLVAIVPGEKLLQVFDLWNVVVGNIGLVGMKRQVVL